jgi:hypothetical protein
MAASRLRAAPGVSVIGFSDGVLVTAAADSG